MASSFTHSPSSWRGAPGRAEGSRRPRERATFLVYVLFGAGYIAYMTFIIAFLRGTTADGATVALFWVVLGSASVGA